MSSTAAPREVSVSRQQGGRVYFSAGGVDAAIDEPTAGKLIDEMLAEWGKLRRVLLVPPDGTRRDAWAGPLTRLLYERLRDSVHVAVMPALGTHHPMTPEQLAGMYPGLPESLFLPHHWRDEVDPLGVVPSEFIGELSEGKLDYDIRVLLNRKLLTGEWDRIVSIGQLVPHEVVGIANHNKNLFVGVGGADMINKTHFLGAVYGMERIMGRPESPVRAVFDYAEQHFAGDFPISYLLTVRGETESKIVTRGLIAGEGKQCFTQGAELAVACNVHRLARRPERVVVLMDGDVYQSTWLANKAIYRARMAVADGGELIVIAPGVKEFGEQSEIDCLIRRHGYRGTDATLAAVRTDPELAGSLSAAAHLIHGSSEGRFRITYAPGRLSRSEIEGVGYAYADCAKMLARYPDDALVPGWNSDESGEFYYINHAGLGLWTAE